MSQRRLSAAARGQRSIVYRNGEFAPGAGANVHIRVDMTLFELLALCGRSLGLPGPGARLFTSDGDEVDDPMLVGEDESARLR